MKLLLVEDHGELRQMTLGHLVARGFAVDAVGRMEDARAALAVGGYDALILDLGLPDGCGIRLLQETRGKKGGAVATLIITARDAFEDRIEGLNAGADDYIIKPFNLAELEARIRAVLRRPGTRREVQYTLGRLGFDSNTREAAVSGQPVRLSRREADLLEILIRAVGRIVVKDELEERLYCFNHPVTPNAVEATVSRLRKRLDAEDARVRIETRRGIGYRLVAIDAPGT